MTERSTHRQPGWGLGIAIAVIAFSAWIWGTRAVVASPLPRSDPRQDTPSASAGSVVDGVFTAEQAKRGGETFQKVCSACHTLAEHSGRKFEVKWSGSTVGELFDLISNTMPDGNPGGLNPEEYVSVIAFFLKETGYPEGKQELPADSAALAKVRIESPARK